MPHATFAAMAPSGRVLDHREIHGLATVSPPAQAFVSVSIGTVILQKETPRVCRIAAGSQEFVEQNHSDLKRLENPEMWIDEFNSAMAWNKRGTVRFEPHSLPNYVRI